MFHIALQKSSSYLFRNEGPDLVQVDGWAELVNLIRVDVEVPHTNLKTKTMINYITNPWPAIPPEF
jgi:hypothetical protein